ncbi:glycosyltransferase family 2 protein [Psychroserpens sp.]|uniref:glycosyltransferase family 2 protein n=1 Tax=Psychroserpens sp. TaxID=2020870 RepID=UPI003C7366B1
MKLSVVILNYNVRYFLELCLKSVEAAISNLDAEIIVVDNKSSDGSCSMIKQLFPKVVLIENTHNGGFSKGNNIGVATAKGDYICILNPDTVVAEDTFTTLLKHSQSKENIGIVSCRLIDGNGLFLPESKRNIPTPSVAIKKILGLSKSYYASHVDEKDLGNVPVFVGAFMLIKRTVYHEVNGFDEDYFMYGEDADLSYKILKAGYENFYDGSTTVIHYKGESTLKDRVYAKRFYGAMQIFYKKHLRSNILFDAVVWFGVRLVPLLKRTSEIAKIKINRYVMITSEKSSELESVLPQPLKLELKLEGYLAHTEYILDQNYLGFKGIISIISNRPKNSLVTFKILPKNSNFIIGSDSSKSRGDVIRFEV